MNAGVLGKNNKKQKRTALVCFVTFLQVKRSLSARWAGDVGFLHLGYIESPL